MLSVQLNEDSLAMGKLEENVTEVDIRNPERASCPGLDKKSGEKDQEQKVEYS